MEKFFYFFFQRPLAKNKKSSMLQLSSAIRKSVMKTYVLCFLSITSLCLSDVADEPLVTMEGDMQEVISSSSSAEEYDRPYSLNPVPINPSTKEPPTWRDAYGRLCRKIEYLEKQVSIMQEKISSLENTAASSSHIEQEEK